jgi:HNH endonuclease
MSPARISAALRREVRERAGERCEYCLLAESQAFFPHEPDHLIALKHGGETVSPNLALSCFDCNRFKGSDIASGDPLTGEFVPLFNPRTQLWSEHFSLHGGEIIPRTACGRATERLLRFNLSSRLEVRDALAARGQYPLQR